MYIYKEVFLWLILIMKEGKHLVCSGQIFYLSKLKIGGSDKILVL